MVFNRNFINDSIKMSSELKGVFTLGEESIKYQEDIDNLTAEIKECDNMLDKKRKSEKIVIQELERQNSTLYDMCWEVKKKLEKIFSETTLGYNNSKKRFTDKCFEVLNKYENSTIPSLEQLQKEYNALFNSSRTPINPIAELDVGLVPQLEQTALLEEIIVGNTDLQIGELISRLKSGDWVKHGIEFAHNSNGKCPYCQQNMPAEIQNEIEAYFDESYKNKCNQLLKYQKTYIDFNNTLKKYESMIPNKDKLFDYSSLCDMVQTLRTEVERNLIKIEKKVNCPSQPVVLNKIASLNNDIQKMAKDINNKIAEWNAALQSQSTEKKCKDRIIFSYLSDLKSSMYKLRKSINSTQDALNKINENIVCFEMKKQQAADKRTEIKSKITSIKPTITNINNVLKCFGFESFELAENNTQEGTYKIIRPSDKSDVQDTLSEGEANFISFLYFYYTCLGSLDQAEIERDKIIVIDDPISSMDSNVLFIVSTLVKDLLIRCKTDKDNICQMIILTHNAYFHKEVTYWGSRNKLSPALGAYFVIRKYNNMSHIKEFSDNPITSTYELLWDDIKNPKSSASTICNTMRRILEHYFKVIGKANYEACIDNLDGSEKLIGKSLISLINDGSHSIFDDYTAVLSVDDVAAYRIVFKKIFKYMGQLDHYNMMMGTSEKVEMQTV